MPSNITTLGFGSYQGRHLGNVGFIVTLGFGVSVKTEVPIDIIGPTGPTGPTGPDIPSGELIALAAHLGGGVVMIHVPSPYPQPSGFSRYEVKISPELDGNYTKFSNFTFHFREGHLVGLPVLGNSIYMQIRMIFRDNTASEWVQVRKGIINNPTVDVSITSVSGSKIPKGEIFTSRKDNTRIFAFRTQEEIKIG